MSNPEVPVDDVLSFFNISKTDPANWLEITHDIEWKLKKTSTRFETLTIYSMTGKKRIYTLDDRSVLDVKIISPGTVRVKGQVYEVSDS